MVVVEAGILCWLVCWVRGDDQHFGELNMPVLGIHHPEITGLYTPSFQRNNAKTGIHHPEITGLHTKLFFNEVEYPVVYRWTLCYHCREAI